METKTKYPAVEVLAMVKNLTKKRLYELMNEGAISYEHERWGNKTRRIIDAAELARVFGSNFNPTPETETVFKAAKKRFDNPEDNLETLYLRREIERLQEQIHYERKEKERERAEFWQRESHYREQNDELSDTIARQTLLLSEMRYKSENRTEQDARPSRKGFFDWLAGAKTV